MSSTAVAVIPGTYTADPIHSSIGFSIKHNVVATFRGHFGSFAATLTVGDDESLALTGTVDVASVQVKLEDLAGHLLSPDFFDAERFPQITFESAAITVDGDQLSLEGDLTLKGVTKTVTGTGSIAHIAESMAGDARIGIDLSTTIDRAAFGMGWNAPLPKGGFALSNDVILRIELELVQAA